MHLSHQKKKKKSLYHEEYFPIPIVHLHNFTLFIPWKEQLLTG